MCSVPGVPDPATEVSVLVTRVNLNQNCGLVKLWVNMKKENRHVYEQMQEEIQSMPKRNFCGSEGKAGNLCLVSVDEKWHRARIVAVHDDKHEVFLIDQAQCHSTTSTAMAWATDECFRLSPEIESCVLANVVSTENIWPERAVNFLKSLPGKDFNGLVQQTLPNRTILLDVPVISKHLCREGVTKKIPVIELKNLVLKCLNLPEEDKIEPMTTEQSLNVCRQLENSDRYFYPELFTNTFENIQVKEVIDVGNIFCELVIFSKSIKILTEQMNEEYKYKSAVEDLQPQIPGMPCAAKDLDGKWRRSVIKQIHSDDSTVEVFFVDDGKHELVRAANVKKLNPKYLRMPVVTYHCSLEGVPRDEEWNKEQLDHLKSITLNQNLIARFERHILPGDSYSVSLFTANAAYINTAFMEIKDQKINGEAKQKLNHKPVLNDAIREASSQSIFPAMKDSFPHGSLFSPVERPISDFLTVGASLPVKVSCIDSTSKFWCQTSQSDKKLDVLMKDLQAFYASVDPKPLVESICVARNPDNNMWYRAKVTSNQPSPDVEVRFVDYGQTKKIPLHELRPIDPTFLRLDGQAFQCSLANLPPTDVNYANQEFHKFVDMCLAQNSGLKCFIKAVESDEDGMLVSMVDLQTQSESVSQVLFEKLAARPGMYQSSHSMEVNSKEKICISYSETVHNFYCHLDRNLHLFQQVQNDVNKEFTNSVHSDFSLAPNSICIARYTDSNWYRGQVLETSPDIKVFFVDLGKTLTLKKADVRPCLNGVSSIKTIPVLAIPVGLFNIPENVPQEINEWFAQKVVGMTFNMCVNAKGKNGKLLVELVDGSKSMNAQIREKIVYNGVGNLTNGTKVTPVADMEVDKQSQQNGSQNVFKVQNGEIDMNDWILVEAEPESSSATKESPEENMETTTEQTIDMEIDKENKTQQPTKKTFSPTVRAKVTYKMPIISFNKAQELYASSISSPDFFWCQCSNTEDLDKVTELAQIEGNAAQSPFFHCSLLIGDPCLALYKDDNMWYRAQVIFPDRIRISVVFVDYGNEADVSVDNVRPISASLLEVAPQAFLCCLDEIDELGLKFKDRFCDRFHSALADKPLKVKVLGQMGQNSEVKLPQYNVQIEDVDMHKLLQKKEILINGDALFKRPITKTVFYSDPNTLVNQTVKGYACSISSPGYFWCQYPDTKELDRISKIAQKPSSAEDPLFPKTLVPGSPCLALDLEDKEWYRAQVISCKNDMFSVVFVDYGGEDDVPLTNMRPIPQRLMEIKPQAFLCYMENFDENEATWDDILQDNFHDLLLNKVIEIKILSMEHNEEIKVPHYTVQFNFDMEKFCKSYANPRHHPLTTWQTVPKTSPKTPDKATKGCLSTENVHDTAEKTPACLSTENVYDTAEKTPACLSTENVHDTAEITPACLSTENVHDTAEKTPAKTLDFDLKNCNCFKPLLGMRRKVKMYASSISGPDYFWCQYSNKLEMNEIIEVAQNEGRKTSYDSNYVSSLVSGDPCLALFSDDNVWNRAKILDKSEDKFSVLFIDYGNEDDVCFNNIRPMNAKLLQTRPQAFLCCLEGFDEAKGMWDDEVYDAFHNLVVDKPLSVKPSSFIEHDEVKMPQFVVQVVCWNTEVNKEMLKYWTTFDTIDEIARGLAENANVSSATKVNISTQRGLKKPNVFLDRTEIVFATCIVDPHYFWCQFDNKGDLNNLTRFAQAAGQTQQLPDILEVGDLCLALFSDDSDPDSDNMWYRAVVRQKVEEKLQVAFIDYGNEAKVSFKNTRLMPQHLLEQPPQAFLCTLHGFDKTKGTWEDKGSDDFYDLLVDKSLKVKLCSMEENKELSLLQYSVQIDCEGVDVNKQMEKYWKGTAEQAPQSSLLGQVFGF